ncbi:hypothetical protein Ccrd_015509 [Cynara cardunculus var. scolymus]|uniref:Uncharacterized protein n=1 Tax=Cynara cardunculus var. scolymus TaxID=59895 RepID=A0A118K3L7_CYNCS|nr:hypothetical protein Ccrd_015509 [Cynara cardunculus var. scolymus]
MKRKVYAHEIHYTTNRAVAEEMRRKTFLPYKSGLLGGGSPSSNMFDECVAHLLDDLFQGYNGTVIAYGQNTIRSTDKDVVEKKMVHPLFTIFGDEDMKSAKAFT